MPHQIATYLTAINFPFYLWLNKLQVNDKQRNLTIMLIVFVLAIVVITLIGVTSYRAPLYGCMDGFHVEGIGPQTVCVHN